MILVRRIICALEYLEPDLDSYGSTIVEDYGAILLALKNLMKSIELRRDYTQFINDRTHDMRWDSHMEYAQYRRDDADLPF